MTRILGALLAIAAGIAIGVTEVIFAPSMLARMDAHPGLLAKNYGAGMLWAALVAVALTVGGVAALLARPRNSN